MNLEYLEACYDECIRQAGLYENHVSTELFLAVHDLAQKLKEETVPEEVKENMARNLEKFIYEKNYYIGIVFYSAIIEFSKNPEWMVRFLSYLKKNMDHFTKNNLYFLYTQIAAKIFTKKYLETVETQTMMWDFLKEIVYRFYKDNPKKYSFIPIEERNRNMIIVLTEQFLGFGHGPTKTALDRCRVIMETMGKQVLLINTAETLSWVGKCPFISIEKANYVADLNDTASITWKGTDIPYFQCDQNMPDYSAMDLILDVIAERKPYCIVSMNGSSITCNLANKIVPVISINLCPSDIAITTVRFQALGRKLNETQKRVLQLSEIPEDSVIESEFTYSFREQTEHYTRQEFGIREEVFLIAVIGTRLDREVTDEFCGMLNDIVSDNREVVFVGTFNNYEELVQAYPNLKEHSYYTGTIKDVVAFGEICDLYVNPIRKGAGGSILEVMKKGVPSITCQYGDAATNVGADFWVSDYAEMKEKILLYYNDKEYYRKMSQKAKERVEYITNNDNAFIKIIDEALRREREGEGLLIV